MPGKLSKNSGEKNSWLRLKTLEIEEVLKNSINTALLQPWSHCEVSGIKIVIDNDESFNIFQLSRFFNS